MPHYAKLSPPEDGERITVANGALHVPIGRDPVYRG